MLKYILLCILAMSGYYAWTIFPIKHGPGVTNPDKPLIQYAAWEKPFSHKGNTLEPVRRYKSDVRVLQKKRYLFDDQSDLSPADILVGWNEMSDERNIEFIHFSIGDRSANVEFTKPPIPIDDIHEQIELLHLIPSTKEIKDQVNKLRPGNRIKLEGIVVNVESTDSYNWSSNLNLSGTEKHRNMIIWVESIQVN